MIPAPVLRLLPAIAALFTALAPSARAADSEIAVYMDEIGAPRALGLELNINHVIAGSRARDYPAQQISDQRIRVTPEFTYAFTEHWEAGVLPLGVIDRDGIASVEGLKARIRYVSPAANERGFFWGANLEAGRVSRNLEESPWGAELRVIAGMHGEAWSIATNLIAEQPLSGDDRQTEIELATKILRQIGGDVALGIESYNTFGALGNITPLAKGDQQIFAVIETAARSWDSISASATAMARPKIAGR